MSIGPGDIALSFFLGILATGAPCVLPLYPGFLAYLSSSPQAFGKEVKVQALGVLVFLGVLTVMIALGLIIATLAVSVGAVVSFITPAADFVIIALGILLLIGKNPFMHFPKISARVAGNPYTNAYIYGLLYGPIAFPCAGPFLVAILAISLSAAEFFSSLGLFVVFGFGFGVPLFALSLLARAKQQAFVSWFTRYQRKIEMIAGSVLIAIALYDLSVNLPFILTYYA